MADVITTLHPEGAPEDNLYPNVKDENIPSNIERAPDVLWINANPNQQFAGGTSVDVGDMSQYSKIRVEYKAASAFDSYDELDIPFDLNNRGRLFFPSDDAIYTRGFIIDSNSVVKFDVCLQTMISTGAVTTYNTFLIPMRILGIK